MNKEFLRIREKYPNKIPTIIKKLRYNDTLPQLKKYKFLIQKELTIGNLIHVIRRNLPIDSTVALYLSINNKIYPSSTSIGHIYDSNINDDFLYVYYIGENTFG